jgi:hypothetical protein
MAAVRFMLRPPACTENSTRYVCGGENSTFGGKRGVKEGYGAASAAPINLHSGISESIDETEIAA